MKGKLFAGALVLSLVGGAALAKDAVEDPAYPTEQDRSVMRGVTVTAGGGIEGYTGGLSDSLAIGPTWGVTAGLKPSKVFGLELGYTGATNELRSTLGFDVNGADVVRNSGQVVATVGLTSTPVQPYLLGGIGLNWYHVRATGSGLSDDTSGNIPLGGGVRAYLGHFTADARLDYNIMFADDLVNRSTTGGGRYTGTISVGSTF
ncbi:MAG TPA: hypothetical protein VIG99_21115 [Myxococcaceae bacterium]